MERCSSRVGMRRSQWQWLRSSLERPRFSEPNKRATRLPERRLRIRGAACPRHLTGCCGSRRPTAVVPTMRVQSATASARLLNSSARARRGEAPTAERASRKANSYGFTTQRWKKPKLLMARAAAPMLRGLRGLTRTTRRLSSWDREDKEQTLFSAAAERKASTTRSNSGRMNGAGGAVRGETAVEERERWTRGHKRDAVMVLGGLA